MRISGRMRPWRGTAVPLALLLVMAMMWTIILPSSAQTTQRNHPPTAIKYPQLPHRAPIPSPITAQTKTHHAASQKTIQTGVPFSRAAGTLHSSQQAVMEPAPMPDPPAVSPMEALRHEEHRHHLLEQMKVESALSDEIELTCPLAAQCGVNSSTSFLEFVFRSTDMAVPALHVTFLPFLQPLMQSLAQHRNVTAVIPSSTALMRGLTYEVERMCSRDSSYYESDPCRFVRALIKVDRVALDNAVELAKKGEQKLHYAQWLVVQRLYVRSLRQQLSSSGETDPASNACPITAESVLLPSPADLKSVLRHVRAEVRQMVAAGQVRDGTYLSEQKIEEMCQRFLQRYREQQQQRDISKIESELAQPASTQDQSQQTGESSSLKYGSPTPSSDGAAFSTTEFTRAAASDVNASATSHKSSPSPSDELMSDLQLHLDAYRMSVFQQRSFLAHVTLGLIPATLTTDAMPMQLVIGTMMKDPMFVNLGRATGTNQASQPVKAGNTTQTNATVASPPAGNTNTTNATTTSNTTSTSSQQQLPTYFVSPTSKPVPRAQFVSSAPSSCGSKFEVASASAPLPTSTSADIDYLMSKLYAVQMDEVRAPFNISTAIDSDIAPAMIGFVKTEDGIKVRWGSMSGSEQGGNPWPQSARIISPDIRLQNGWVVQIVDNIMPVPPKTSLVLKMNGLDAFNVLATAAYTNANVSTTAPANASTTSTPMPMPIVATNTTNTTTANATTTSNTTVGHGTAGSNTSTPTATPAATPTNATATNATTTASNTTTTNTTATPPPPTMTPNATRTSNASTNGTLTSTPPSHLSTVEDVIDHTPAITLFVPAGGELQQLISELPRHVLIGLMRATEAVEHEAGGDGDDELPSAQESDSTDRPSMRDRLQERVQQISSSSDWRDPARLQERVQKISSPQQLASVAQSFGWTSPAARRRAAAAVVSAANRLQDDSSSEASEFDTAAARLQAVQRAQNDARDDATEMWTASPTSDTTPDVSEAPSPPSPQLELEPEMSTDDEDDESSSDLSQRNWPYLQKQVWTRRAWHPWPWRRFGRFGRRPVVRRQLRVRSAAMHPAESASDLPESESQLMSEEPTPDTIVLDSNDTAIYTGIAALNGTVPWFAAWCQANLPSGSMQPSGHPSLAAVSLLLKTHIFNGLLYSPSFVDGRTLTSHAGLQFTLGCVGGGWKIGGAEVVHTDILSKNAVIHVVSHPLSRFRSSTQNQSANASATSSYTSLSPPSHRLLPPPADSEVWEEQGPTKPTAVDGSEATSQASSSERACLLPDSRRCWIIDNLPHSQSKLTGTPSYSFVHASNRASPLECIGKAKSSSQNTSTNASVSAAPQTDSASMNSTAVSVCYLPRVFTCDAGRIELKASRAQQKAMQLLQPATSGELLAPNASDLLEPLPAAPIDVQLPLALQPEYEEQLATPSRLFDTEVAVELQEPSGGQNQTSPAEEKMATMREMHDMYRTQLASAAETAMVDVMDRDARHYISAVIRAVRRRQAERSGGGGGGEAEETSPTEESS